MARPLMVVAQVWPMLYRFLFIFFLTSKRSSCLLILGSVAASSAGVPDDKNAAPATMQTPTPMNVIVVGGSSGMGKAAALQVAQSGGNVLLVSRNHSKLERARQEIQRMMTSTTAAATTPQSPSSTSSLQSEDPTRTDPPSQDEEGEGLVSIYSCDCTDETQVKQLAESLTPNYWNGLVVSAAGKAPHGPMESLPTIDTRNILESKFWTAYHCAKYIGPKLHTADDGEAASGGETATTTRSAAIVFVAGILNRRPGVNCVPLAVTNGALEGLTRALALEWGPNIRVNCLSPGFCDTERFDHMDTTRKEGMLSNTAQPLPLRRVGRPHDMGQAIYYLLTANFVTGIVLDVDGGHLIRQYANPVNDPMRKQRKKQQ